MISTFERNEHKVGLNVVKTGSIDDDLNQLEVKVQTIAITGGSSSSGIDGDFQVNNHDISIYKNSRILVNIPVIINDDLTITGDINSNGNVNLNNDVVLNKNTNLTLNIPTIVNNNITANNITTNSNIVFNSNTIKYNNNNRTIEIQTKDNNTLYIEDVQSKILTQNDINYKYRSGWFPVYSKSTYIPGQNGLAPLINYTINLTNPPLLKILYSSINNPSFPLSNGVIVQDITNYGANWSFQEGWRLNYTNSNSFSLYTSYYVAQNLLNYQRYTSGFYCIFLY